MFIRLLDSLSESLPVGAAGANIFSGFGDDVLFLKILAQKRHHFF